MFLNQCYIFELKHRNTVNHALPYLFTTQFMYIIDIYSDIKFKCVRGVRTTVLISSLWATCLRSTSEKKMSENNCNVLKREIKLNWNNHAWNIIFHRSNIFLRRLNWEISRGYCENRQISGLFHDLTKFTLHRSQQLIIFIT